MHCSVCGEALLNFDYKCTGILASSKSHAKIFQNIMCCFSLYAFRFSYLHLVNDSDISSELQVTTLIDTSIGFLKINIPIGIFCKAQMPQVLKFYGLLTSGTFVRICQRTFPCDRMGLFYDALLPAFLALRYPKEYFHVTE